MRLSGLSIKRNIHAVWISRKRLICQISLSFLAVLVVFQYFPELQAFAYRSNPTLSTKQKEVALTVVGTRMSLVTFEPVRTPSLSLVAATVDQKGVVKNITHTVTEGETLSGIADKYGLHSGSIVLANPDIPDTELIHQGDVLTIPPQDADAAVLNKEYKERMRKLGSVAHAAESATSTPTTTTTRANVAVPSSKEDYIIPVRYDEVSQGFSRGHTGIDFATDIGTPVKATRSGCIIEASNGWSGGYGKMLKLDHGDGTSSLYGHLSSFVAKSGQCVSQGQLIGYSGNSGRSTGPHLHFEIRKNDTPVNPAPYVY